MEGKKEKGRKAAASVHTTPITWGGGGGFFWEGGGGEGKKTPTCAQTQWLKRPASAPAHFVLLTRES